MSCARRTTPLHQKRSGGLQNSPCPPQCTSAARVRPWFMAAKEGHLSHQRKLSSSVGAQRKQAGFKKKHFTCVVQRQGSSTRRLPFKGAFLSPRLPPPPPSPDPEKLSSLLRKTSTCLTPRPGRPTRGPPYRRASSSSMGPLARETGCRELNPPPLPPPPLSPPPPTVQGKACKSLDRRGVS